MYKTTAKDVKMLQQWGNDNEVVKGLIDKGAQPNVFLTGYYSPSQANWSWQIGIAKIGNSYYELLLRFGSVEGGRLINIPEVK